MKDRLNYIKRESVIGLPVIDGKTNKRLGVVKDFYLNDNHTYLEGLFVTRNGWGRRDMDIPFSGITIGTDTIIAEGEIQNRTDTNPQSCPNLGRLLKKRVIKEDGQELGIISDILLDPLTGRIEGLELSEGIIDDLLYGRKVIPHLPYEQSDGDVVVITLEQAEKITSYNKGIKNIFLNKI